jgi:serine/threonine-protein kinase
MALHAGDRIGTFEITGSLGAGGMGEVWRARDTKLHRDVALKLITDAFAHDPDRLARFEREARTLASLNHPNLAQVYGLEESRGDEPASPPVEAIVMELIEGPTLADRVAEGPIPVDDALPIAKQIAEATEAAHEHGIVHRDLKPANIKVRPDGAVKVLDFGLAKAVESGPARPSSAASMSPTITSPALTERHVILGTAVYMSPEQARGKPVDRRTDIWAFGCVLYEMLTGRRAFGPSRGSGSPRALFDRAQGEKSRDDKDDVTVTLARVLEREPDMTVLPADVPARVLAALRVCLVKDSRQRAAAIHDVWLALEGAFDHGPGPAVGASSSPLWHRLWPTVAACVVTVLVAATIAWGLWPERSTQFFPSALPSDWRHAAEWSTPSVNISPDGTRLVFVVEEEGRSKLVARSVDRLDFVQLAESTNPAFSPFFSADGRWVGFVDVFRDRFQRVPVDGGTARDMGPLPSGTSVVLGAAWTEDDTIIFGTSNPTGLWRAPADAREDAAELTTLDVEAGEINHTMPYVLPTGNAVLFTVLRSGAPPGEESQIWVLDLESKQRRRLGLAGGTPVYVAATGHLVYALGGDLWAVPFDVDALEVPGTGRRVGSDVLSKWGGLAEFAVGDDGTLLYVSGSIDTLRATTPVWVDMQGGAESAGLPSGPYRGPRISPDGTRVAFMRLDQDEDIVVGDLTSGSVNAIAPDPGQDVSPYWRDARQLIFASDRGGGGLYQAPADSSSPATRVSPRYRYAVYDVAGDGKLLAGRWGTNDIDLLDPRNGEVTPLLNERHNERRPVLSHDKRWLAYVSDQSKQFEVWVRTFPRIDDRLIPISRGGGAGGPIWSPDGKFI